MKVGELELPDGRSIILLNNKTWTTIEVLLTDTLIDGTIVEVLENGTWKIIGKTDLSKSNKRPKVGDFHLGGIIAHIAEPGQTGYIEGEVHGLIISEFDLGEVSIGRKTYKANTGIDYGSGAENTQIIIQKNMDDGLQEAARLCNDLNINGFDDWFLPSINELSLIFKNVYSSDLFSNSRYWSSSEMRWSPRNKQIQYIVSMGFQGSTEEGKTVTHIISNETISGRVRAARYF